MKVTAAVLVCVFGLSSGQQADLNGVGLGQPPISSLRSSPRAPALIARPSFGGRPFNSLNNLNTFNNRAPVNQIRPLGAVPTGPVGLPLQSRPIQSVSGPVQNDLLTPSLPNLSSLPSVSAVSPAPVAVSRPLVSPVPARPASVAALPVRPVQAVPVRPAAAPLVSRPVAVSTPAVAPAFVAGVANTISHSSHGELPQPEVHHSVHNFLDHSSSIHSSGPILSSGSIHSSGPVISHGSTPVVHGVSDHGGDHGASYGNEQPDPFHFEYGVHDDKYYTDFSEARTGDEYGNIVGEYQVALPDGRIQYVKYTADANYGGTVMEVSYKGEARHPEVVHQTVHSSSHDILPDQHFA